MSKETNKIISKKLSKEVGKDFYKAEFKKNKDCYIKHLKGKKEIMLSEELDMEEAEIRIDLKNAESNNIMQFISLCVATLSIVFSVAINIMKTDENDLTGLLFLGIIASITMIIYTDYSAIRSLNLQKKITYCQFKLECIEMYRNEHEEELKQQNL